jgi:hypothetical protein
VAAPSRVIGVALTGCAGDFAQGPPPPPEPTTWTPCQYAGCPDPEPPPPLPPSCEQHPCITDLAVASARPDAGLELQFGWSLGVASTAGGERHAVIGAPGPFFTFGNADSRAELHTVPDLRHEGTWPGEANDLFGIATDIADIDHDGIDEIAIARLKPNEGNEGGRVNVVAATAIDTAIDAGATITIDSGEDTRLGFGLAFADAGAELWAAGTTTRAAGGCSAFGPTWWASSERTTPSAPSVTRSGSDRSTPGTPTAMAGTTSRWQAQAAWWCYSARGAHRQSVIRTPNGSIPRRSTSAT